MRKAVCTLVLSTVLVALVAATVAHAHAAFPGKVGRLAFGMKGTDGNTDVYSMLPDGSGVTRLTTAGSFDACATYSPDGRSIAFCSDREGGFEVWLMSADGSGQRRLTRSPYDALFPRFAPDGRRVAYEAAYGGPPATDIYVVDVRGGKAKRFTGAPGDDVSPTFSPDGKTIAFISARKKGTPQIWLMNGSDGRNQRPLTGDATPKGTRVDWSPDGSLLAYEAGNDIWLVGADGKNPRNLTRSKAVEFGPTWSPDGEEIAFVRMEGSKKQVYVMNDDGSYAHPVGGGGAQLVPTWQGIP